jgi:hypothetical protein
MTLPPFASFPTAVLPSIASNVPVHADHDGSGVLGLRSAEPVERLVADLRLMEQLALLGVPGLVGRAVGEALGALRAVLDAGAVEHERREHVAPRVAVEPKPLPEDRQVP